MFNHKVKLKSIILITLLIIMLCFLGANGNGQQGGNTNVFEPEKINIEEKTSSREEIPTEPIISPEEDQPEQKKTNLVVLLVDNINGSNLRLRNCILRLVGEMNIAEDLYTYDNYFVDGDIYKITVLIELNEVIEKSE